MIFFRRAGMNPMSAKISDVMTFLEHSMLSSQVWIAEIPLDPPFVKGEASDAVSFISPLLKRLCSDPFDKGGVGGFERALGLRSLSQSNMTMPALIGTNLNRALMGMNPAPASSNNVFM
jgi:hypothetical protein